MEHEKHNFYGYAHVVLCSNFLNKVFTSLSNCNFMIFTPKLEIFQFTLEIGW